MYTVYVLEDDEGKRYKGITNNLARQLGEHARGRTKTTSTMKNLKVLYTEAYVTSAEARKRELHLKSAAGRKFLKKTLGV